MGYKNIRILGFLTAAIGGVFILTAAAEAVGFVGEGTPRFRDMLLALAITFMLMGQLVRNISSILETQADQIADLQRQLSAGRTGN